MNSCAICVSEEFPDVVFLYGFSDEYRYCNSDVICLCSIYINLVVWELHCVVYSFVFKKTSKFYQRRARFLFWTLNSAFFVCDASKIVVTVLICMWFSGCIQFQFWWNNLYANCMCSKVESIIVSFFTSVYVMKWKEFFPHKELRYSPSFHAQVISCASIEVLQSYLLWRQTNCK